ncbi:probable poly(ADP-ribose) glycohydrolase 2 [Coffea arabica]|uniref:Probable poly(ADP-ribose) glycohydrolase 2 n=1 Tax=Coffea arabica TaxID=13443 RepID=A0ABM4X6T5_COFAR
MRAKLVLNISTKNETHYRRQQQQPLDSNTTCLRLLDSQQPGLVLLSQELIAALLSCAFFSLFPAANRGATYLPAINFHHLFANVLRALFVDIKEQPAWATLSKTDDFFFFETGGHKVPMGLKFQWVNCVKT